MPGCPYDRPPPLVFTGSAPPGAIATALDERTALALGAEPEVLEEQDRGDREGVVELKRSRRPRVRGRPRRRPARRTAPRPWCVRSVMPEMWRWPTASPQPSTWTAAPRSSAARSAATTTSAPPPSVTRQQSRTPSGSQTRGARSTSATLSGSRDHARSLPLRPGARGDRDLGELLGRRAERVHVARGGQRVAGDRQQRAVGRLVGVDLLHRRGRAPHRALRAAVGDQRDVAQARADRRPRVGDVGHGRRAADLRAVDVARAHAERLGEVQRRHRQLRRRREQRRRRRRPRGRSPPARAARPAP